MQPEETKENSSALHEEQSAALRASHERWANGKKRDSSPPFRLAHLPQEFEQHLDAEGKASWEKGTADAGK